MDIEQSIKQAINNDSMAMESVIRAIQDDVYYLALRMLANPDDAKEATQEILIKVLTKLETFKFQSQFKTWVYRVASNYLLSEKIILNKYPELSFDMYKADLESDLKEADDLEKRPDYLVLLNEMRTSCTMAMLLCLNPSHRMSYILGDIFEVSHQEGSEVLSTSQDNFRKMLSRARAKVIKFTTESCGLVSDTAPCHCHRKLKGAIDRQRINIAHIRLADSEVFSFDEVQARIRDTQKDLKTLALQNSVSHYKCPIVLGELIESIAAHILNMDHS